MDERKLRGIGAGLLIAGAVALGVQVAMSLIWVPGALPFIIVASGPQLVAGVWVLLPWSSRRAVRYVPAMLLGGYVAFWNIAVILEGLEGQIPAVPPLVGGALLLLLAIQGLFPLLAVGAFSLSWWLGSQAPSNGAR